MAIDELQPLADSYARLVENWELKNLTAEEVRAARAVPTAHHRVGDAVGGLIQNNTVRTSVSPSSAWAMRQAWYAACGAEQLACVLAFYDEQQRY